MRAVSLVRYWLYGLRGFVVMTISLAIAFSIAVTGPPTDHEIGVVTGVLNRAAADFSDDLETAAIQLCPQLPEEVGVVCAPTLTVEPPQQPPPVQAEKPSLNEIAAADAPAPQAQPETQRTSESQLLGAPPSQRARPERTQRRANAERRSTHRAQLQRRAARAPPQRPARTQPTHTTPAPAPEAAVVQLPRAEPPSVVRDGASGAVDAEPAREDSAYADEEEDRDWRERRRERRRRYEREAEPDDYYEDEYYEEGAPEEYYERSDWPGDTH